MKKIIAAVLAAAVAVSAAAFTVSAAENVILNVGYPCGINYEIENKDSMTEGRLGAAKLVAESWCASGEYADPGFILSQASGASLENYSALELEYDCDNPNEIEYLSLAVQGGSAEWLEHKESPAASGKIVLDITPKRNKTYDTMQFWAHPADNYKLGDTFDPGITIRSAKLVIADSPYVPGIGATVLAPNEWSGDTYALPEFPIVESWTNPKSLIKYSSLELEYECGNVSEIEFLKLVIHGGSCDWIEIKAMPNESGKIVLDLTDIRDKTFEAALLYVQPIDSYKIGDTFDPQISVTRAEFVTYPDFCYSMKFTDKPVNLVFYKTDTGLFLAFSNNFFGNTKGTMKWGDVKNDTFKLTDIEYKSDSANFSAEDYRIYPVIKIKNGRSVDFYAGTETFGDFQSSEAEWKLSDIVTDENIKSYYGIGNPDIVDVESVGYNIQYMGDYSKLESIVNDSYCIILNPSGLEAIPVDLAFSERQHNLFICENSYYDNDGTAKTVNIARNYVDLPQPDGVEYGVTSVGDLNGRTFTLDGINFKDCSVEGIGASDIKVMFCIQTDDGYERYFSGTTMDNSSLVWTAYFNQDSEIYNNKIVSMGYGLWIENDITNGMKLGETLIVNREEIVNEEHNISVLPVDGSLDEGLTLDVTESNTEDIEVKPEDEAVVGKILFAYDIKLMNGSESVQPGCTIKISIPVPAGVNGAQLKVYHAEQDGSFTDMNAEYDPVSNTLVFETSHLSVYVLSDNSSVLGDVDGNGVIDLADVILLGRSFMGQNPNEYAAIADMDGDGTISLADVILLGRLFMNQA